MKKPSIKTWFSAPLCLIVLMIFAGTAGADVNKFHPYPSPQQRQQEVLDLAAKYPERVSVFEYGKSVEGRPLTAFKISRPGTQDKPAAWMGSVIHGNESTGRHAAATQAENSFYFLFP